MCQRRLNRWRIRTDVSSPDKCRGEGKDDRIVEPRYCSDYRFDDYKARDSSKVKLILGQLMQSQRKRRHRQLQWYVVHSGLRKCWSKWIPTRTTVSTTTDDKCPYWYLYRIYCLLLLNHDYNAPPCSTEVGSFIVCSRSGILGRIIINYCVFSVAFIEMCKDNKCMWFLIATAIRRPREGEYKTELLDIIPSITLTRALTEISKVRVG